MRNKIIDVFSDNLSGGGAEFFICNIINSKLLKINKVYSFQNKKANVTSSNINYFNFFIFVYKSCQQGNYVYIHLSKSSFFTYIYLMFFKSHSKYCVFHEHTIPEFYYNLNSPFKWFFSKIYLWLRKIVYSRRQVKVIFGSEKQKIELEAQLSNSKKSFFFYYKLPFMKTISLNDFKFNSYEFGSSIKFYSVSRVENIKRIDLCILALSDVAKNFPYIQFQFDIFGLGSQLENLKFFSKTHSRGNLRISFRGYLIDYNLVKSHHFLLSTSKTEGFGLSVLEALFLKKHVIALNSKKIYSYFDFKSTFENFKLSKEENLNSFVFAISENVHFLLKNENKNLNIFKPGQSWPSFNTAVENLNNIICER
jgi:glycosyltransferase involved in cell wall biosynthesis